MRLRMVFCRAFLPGVVGMRTQLMKCPHGRTAEHGCKQCTPPKVTATGRAISAGKVTRRSNLVRTRMNGQERPLPMDKQCHPKALTRTPRHPECYARTPQWGLSLQLEHLTRDDLLRGKGLKRAGRFELRTTKLLGRTDDITYAMAYQIRARARYITLEVIDNGL